MMSMIINNLLYRFNIFSNPKDVSLLDKYMLTTENKELIINNSNTINNEKLINTDEQQTETELISEEEFQKARNKFENDLVSGNSSIAGIAENLADNDVYYGDANRVNTLLENYMKVTREDIQRVALKYLTQDARVILHYLPKEK